MPKKQDLINQRFNYLTVIKDSGQRNASGSVLWECKCDCGKITLASGTDLKRGHKKSCGCYQKKIASETGKQNIIDLTGMQFGELLVISQAETQCSPNGCHLAMWRCKCSCGAFTTVRGQSLKNGNTNSCGCIKSLGEQKIAKMLSNANISYIREFIFSDFKPYRFDFFVDNKYVIEYDGKQHFENCSWGKSEDLLEDNQKRDNLKNYYCFQKNIPIIRIPYTHFNNLTIKDLLIETSDFILKY